MICKKCGNQVDEKAMFCSFCGEALEKDTVCKKCGNILRDEDSFCTYCGEPVTQEEEPRRCTYCDAILPDTVGEFCPNCGCSLDLIKDIEEWNKAYEPVKESEIKKSNQGIMVPILIILDIVISLLTLIMYYF